MRLNPDISDSLPVVRELPTPAGPLDILYINPKGFLSLVETKLWRNPEARRSVVAQINRLCQRDGALDI